MVKFTYKICQDFPKDEIFGLQSQIKRSSVSVPSNIAEGYGRQSTKSYLQFIRIARGSLLELETQLIIAKELDFVNQSKFDKMSDLIVEENKMINAFIRSVEKSN